MGLKVLTAGLGIAVPARSVVPFGFLKGIHLVGVSGLCNNPLKDSSEWCNEALCFHAGRRAPVTVHAYNVYGDFVYDATIGPVLGDVREMEYFGDLIELPSTGVYGTALDEKHSDIGDINDDFRIE